MRLGRFLLRYNEVELCPRAKCHIFSKQHYSQLQGYERWNLVLGTPSLPNWKKNPSIVPDASTDPLHRIFRAMGIAPKFLQVTTELVWKISIHYVECTPMPMRYFSGKENTFVDLFSWLDNLFDLSYKLPWRFCCVFHQLLSFCSPFWLVWPFCWPFWASSNYLHPMTDKIFSATIHLCQMCAEIFGEIVHFCRTHTESFGAKADLHPTCWKHVFFPVWPPHTSTHMHTYTFADLKR